MQIDSQCHWHRDIWLALNFIRKTVKFLHVSHESLFFPPFTDFKILIITKQYWQRELSTQFVQLAKSRQIACT